MEEFKIGDSIIRIGESWGRVKKGQTYIISDIIQHTNKFSIKIVGDNLYEYAPFFFKKIKRFPKNLKVI
jgi:hypothetical protein